MIRLWLLIVISVVMTACVTAVGFMAVDMWMTPTRPGLTMMQSMGLRTLGAFCFAAIIAIAIGFARDCIVEVER